MQHLKTFKIALSCAAALTALSAKAETGFRFQPYTGFAWQYISLDYAKNSDAYLGDESLYNDELFGATLYMGLRLHDYFGVELGYSGTAESKKKIDFLNAYGVKTGVNTNTSLWLSSLTFDVLGYLPLGAAKKYELIGSVGLARTRAKSEFHSSPVDVFPDDYDETETDLRLGLGAQYKLSDNSIIRSMIRWEDSGFDTVDDAYMWDLGFNYSF